MRSLAKAITELLASLYRWVISPFLHWMAGPGYGCRFEPSCGEYTRQALHAHGFFKGGALALRRVSRCRPGGGQGYDPIPLATDCGRRAPRD